ncbi:MAG TPA: oxygenase MpaB family protein [Lunatimonas sp.]|nr:oxygenase MpaB family protein [Lunatimonas sp.]
MGKFTLYNEQNLNKLKHLGDPLADDAAKMLIKSPEICREINEWTSIPQILPGHFPVEVYRYFDWMKISPVAVDRKKVLRAQRFFEKKGTLYLTLLGFYSLPYSYAFADGAQVLVRSKRIMEDVGKRLTETAFFVLECFRPASFIGDDQSVLSLAKVRLIHAFSRYFIQKHASDWKPEWGIPINQEDLLQTNLVFGFLVMRSMRKIGLTIPEEEVVASLHYWKIIGHYLGINIEYWPDTAREAYFLEKSIRNRHLKSSEAGRKLTKVLINYYREFFQNPATTRLAEDLVAFLLGEKAADALGLKRSSPFATPVYQLLLQTNLFGTSSQPKSYAAQRKLFEANSQKQLGAQVRLNIPVIPQRNDR